MAENNDLLKVPFIRETDGCWHLRYQSNGDPVFFHIDSGTKKFEANILTTHIGLVENRVEFMDRPSFLNGIQSREFFLNYNEGIYVDLRSNVHVSYCGILGSLEQSEQPSLAITSDETSASIAITDSDGNSIATGDDITVLLSTNGGRDLLTYEGEPVELTEAGEYDVISYVLEEGSLPNASDIVHVSIAGKEPEPQPDYLYFEAVEANSTVSMMSTLTTAPDLEYSTDGETWQEWQHTTADGTHTFDTITLTEIGDKVYLRGNNPNGFLDIENDVFSFFSMTGKIAAHGNAQSIVDGDTPTLEAKTMPWFSDALLTEESNDVLVSAPSLPATTLVDNCYNGMFAYCTGLTQAPNLPATTLANNCYNFMFAYCTGLTQAPSLPATTLANNCYSLMFSGCTGLTQAPSLPATTLANNCYSSMFSGCTGLTQAPNLPATALAVSCYDYMFSGCNGLTQAPSLPATTLANNCYSFMFSGCTGLTQAPSLPATALAVSCYINMFSGCTGLTQAPNLPATALAVSCYDYMFSGCNGLTQAPALPATTLVDKCYYGMFSGCTGLTQAPSLPATALAVSCYDGMFSGCTGLTQAPALPATTLADHCYINMFDECIFDMSTDGTTFNFAFGATPPVTVGVDTFSTYYDIAEWMGNTNGFTTP